MRKLRLAVAFITEPVWEIFPDGGVDEIDPKDLPISDALKRDLCAWAAQLHATYDSNYPPDSHFSTQAEEDEFYEQLQQRWQMVSVESPIVLADLTPEQVEKLTEIGIEVAPFGDNLWAIRSVPEPLHGRDDCDDAIRELAQGANLEAALVATACRTAIRNGKKLTKGEMQTLVTQWQRTARSRTCPHGRPICLTLKESSLARYFRRSWVIGKSHGI